MRGKKNSKKDHTGTQENKKSNRQGNRGGGRGRRSQSSPQGTGSSGTHTAS
jgi:hypothetical protein